MIRENGLSMASSFNVLLGDERTRSDSNRDVKSQMLAGADCASTLPLHILTRLTDPEMCCEQQQFGNAQSVVRRRSDGCIERRRR
jgi:hypothetical protein